jgi:hypothetical protein
MSMEQPPNPESEERAVLVEALRTKGIEDEETRELLIAWTEKQKADAFEIGTREAQVRAELNTAALYAEAGFTKAAQESLVDAYYQAHEDQLEDLEDEIAQKALETGLDPATLEDLVNERFGL